ncbi:MAG: hypothetical protein AB7T10_08775 [bacterium]
MARVFFLCVNEKRILVMDISSIKDVKESVKVIDEAEEIITRLPLKSVLILTDVSDTSYNMFGIEKLKSFSRNITPFVIASTVVGAVDEKNMVIEMLERISGRKITVTASRDEAIKYLSGF